MSDRFKFRILHECCTCGKFRWLFFDVAHSNNSGFENHFIAWSERPCGCPWHAIGQGFKAIGDPEQCTGLKDKNDKLIFEGDILTRSWDYTTLHGTHCKGTQIAKVVFDEGAAVWETEAANGNGDALWEVREQSEIIGNIHQNPELLTEKDKENATTTTTTDA